MGNLPLVPIHIHDSIEFVDPYLQGKVNSIWTFDVTKNPGLSIKDVMARQMIEDARQNGALTHGMTIVEATSGNTGAGLALVAAYYGYRTILILPDKISEERIERLRKLGSHVIVTPTNVEPSHPLSYYSIRDMLATLPGMWVASQYDNLANRKAHELITGPEIWEQTHGKVTTVIAAAGTGGTISGIGRYLKKQNPQIKIIGVDPVGSILYLLKQGKSIREVQHLAHSYDLQGFGEDIHPQNFDFDVIDTFIRVNDASGLQMTRLLVFLPDNLRGLCMQHYWRQFKLAW